LLHQGVCGGDHRRELLLQLGARLLRDLGPLELRDDRRRGTPLCELLRHHPCGMLQARVLAAGGGAQALLQVHQVLFESLELGRGRVEDVVQVHELNAGML
jgi:hypothetical protein